MRRLLLGLAAAASGAAGLGLEAVLLSSAGLALGYGRSSAVGLSLWVCAWAVGAWLAGRTTHARRAQWLALGLADLGAAVVATRVLLTDAATAGSELAALGFATFAIALPAVLQGFFLPWIARAVHPESGGAREVGWLFGANLLGAVAGARVIGHNLVGAVGRPGAALAAGTLALAAALLVLAVSPPIPRDVDFERGPAPPPRRAIGLPVAALLAGLGTAWAIGLQWVGLRLGVLWLGGMQSALSDVLAAGLVGLALGAWLLPPLLPRDARGVVGLVALALLGTRWPFHAAPLLRSLDEEGRHALVALVLVAPSVAPLGAWIPCLHRALGARLESGRRLGDLLLHEAWGAALGAPALYWWVVPTVGLGGALGVLSALGALAALLLTGSAPRAAWATSALALAACAWAFRSPPPALASPRLANPAFTLLAFEEDAEFAVTVVDDGLLGERTLLTDSFRATGTGDDYLYMRVLGHLPLLLHPAPRRVAVLAFGTGTTAGAVALHPEVERIDVLELSRAVCRQAPFFESVNRGVFAEGLPGLEREDDGANRVVLRVGDGRRTLARAREPFDVIAMEPLLPDSPFAVYLYTAEFYARARAALAPGGLLCQWIPPHALEPATFDAVVAAFSGEFEWTGVFLVGSQVILVGAASCPELSPRRFPDEHADPQLREALTSLGLAQPSGVHARFVTDGAHWPRAERPLTDGDPWIAYRERRRGAVLLGDLPHNLGRLRRLEQPPPAAWSALVGADGARRLDEVRALHHARERWEGERARLAGAPWEPDPGLAGALLPGPSDDPEVLAFQRRVRFEEARSAGVIELQTGRDGDALRDLVAAASLRPERADVHLLVAVAAARLGEGRVSRAALRRALEACPRLLETRQGRLALALGLDPDASALPAGAGEGAQNPSAVK